MKKMQQAVVSLTLLALALFAQALADPANVGSGLGSAVSIPTGQSAPAPGGR
ncbi:hypothetical protein [Calidithermus chliarophilus]|uniref:hypothetical protein n=1 Tax=Calidithermus chliarophilus TaxID=52023 RepID=UPI0012F6B1E1|nr:hypothetical protein [Calidithermus chliarophilus]